MDDVTWLVWIDRGKTAAAFLVAVGVAMEFALGWLEGPARNRIDEAREARIAEANKGAADANRRAAEANEKAEHEALERRKIEEKLAPRRLTVEQKQSIATKLMHLAKQKVNVMTFSADGEVARLADDIVDAIAGPNGAGWVVNFSSATQVGIIVTGVVVEIKGHSSAHDRKALRACGGVGGRTHRESDAYIRSRRYWNADGSARPERCDNNRYRRQAIGAARHAPPRVA